MWGRDLTSSSYSARYLVVDRCELMYCQTFYQSPWCLVFVFYHLCMRMQHIPFIIYIYFLSQRTQPYGLVVQSMGFGDRQPILGSHPHMAIYWLCGFRHDAYLLCKIGRIIIPTYRTVARCLWDNIDKGEQLILSLGIWKRLRCFPLVLTHSHTSSLWQVVTCRGWTVPFATQRSLARCYGQFYSQWKEWEPWSGLNWRRAWMTRRQGEAAESAKSICPRNGVPQVSI